MYPHNTHRETHIPTHKDTHTTHVLTQTHTYTHNRETHTQRHTHVHTQHTDTQRNTHTHTDTHTTHTYTKMHMSMRGHTHTHTHTRACRCGSHGLFDSPTWKGSTRKEYRAVGDKLSSVLIEVVPKKIIAGPGIILVSIKKMYSLHSFPSGLPTVQTL